MVLLYTMGIVVHPGGFGILWGIAALWWYRYAPLVVLVHYQDNGTVYRYWHTVVISVRLGDVGRIWVTIDCAAIVTREGGVFPWRHWYTLVALA